MSTSGFFNFPRSDDVDKPIRQMAISCMHYKNSY